mmetsp:Transcript_25661/g.37634  ORF Transcript_25661/g.37634 Transcript_25661/m.37634 type:complete len:623 (-) Transcript_25661:1850-3718(-)
MADWYDIKSPNIPSSSSKEKTQSQTPPLPFTSRRSSLICCNGCVATSQPLASSIGLQILRDKNGNAADASIAIAAALAVLEPCSTGLGGDMFALHYSAQTKQVEAVNGSGRSPQNLSLDLVKKDCPSSDDKNGVCSTKFSISQHAVTVPGAAAGWEDFYNKFSSGNLTFAELLEPAAQLAEEGFPVAPLTAHFWKSGFKLIRRWFNGDEEERIPLTIDGKHPPNAGDIIQNKDMARVLRSLGTHGAYKGFYDNEKTGHAIVSTLQKIGGTMTISDLKNQKSTFPQPIYATYRKYKLWQVPPNGQGVAGLIALSGLEELERRNIIPRIEKEGDLAPRSTSTMHAMIEMMRLGFGDARSYVCDPDYAPNSSSSIDYSSNNTESGNGDKEDKTSTKWLLDQKRIGDRAAEIFQPNKAVAQGIPDSTSCTVSFQVVDKEGNAASFVNSNFAGFGTGIVPDGCGFTLQNRGFGFNVDDPNHPNSLQPNKRPYHTIIPGIITHHDEDEENGKDLLYATISNMGGYMQPQGHMQLTVDMVAGGLDPQAAIDQPRFCIVDGTQAGTVLLEDGVDPNVVEDLQRMGHNMTPRVSGYDRSAFGRAQIIRRNRDTGVLWAGSDGRADGCAMGY